MAGKTTIGFKERKWKSVKRKISDLERTTKFVSRSLILLLLKVFSQIVFFNISLKDKNMKKHLKPQLSVPVRYGKKSKEAPKKLPENLTAVHLPLKVHCALPMKKPEQKTEGLE